MPICSHSSGPDRDCTATTIYALFSGLMFIAVMGIILGPVLIRDLRPICAYR